MDRNIQRLIVCGILLVPGWTMASPKELTCSIASYIDIIRCADKYGASTAISTQRMRAADELVAAAEEWVNPEFAAESIASGTSYENSAALVFTIQLGGKRMATINNAHSEYEKSRAENKLDVSGARLELMLNLYRLQHKKNEIRIEEESVSTFEKILAQYQGRRAPFS